MSGPFEICLATPDGSQAAVASTLPSLDLDDAEYLASEIQDAHRRTHGMCITFVTYPGGEPITTPEEHS